MTIDLSILLSSILVCGAWVAPAGMLTGTTKNLAVTFFEWFGSLTLFVWRLIPAALRPPYEGRELLRQLDAVGTRSLPLVAMAGAATGIVLALQIRESLTRFGGKALVPAVIVFAILRESGPIITGFVVSGRVGAGIGAELGSMKVTEQIDAMEVMGVDPLKYLVATRVLACMLMLPLLTLVASFCGIMTGWVASTLAEPVSLRLFIERGFKSVTFHDFLPPAAKTVVFGFIIGVIASYQGMRTEGGTEGVGKSATSSVVLASLFVVLADVLLVRLILVLAP
jgi:phospholipid/cholesterol/gamma-HCH transport system permease protein